MDILARVISFIRAGRPHGTENEAYSNVPCSTQFLSSRSIFPPYVCSLPERATYDADLPPLSNCHLSLRGECKRRFGPVSSLWAVCGMLKLHTRTAESATLSLVVW